MRPSDPSDHPEILGKHFATRNCLPILVIGTGNRQRKYNRYELGAMGCPHPNAIAQLDRVLKQLGVHSIEHLVRHFSPEDFAEIKGFGVTAFYVLTCVLRHARVDLKDFYKAKVTVDTLKERIKADNARGSAVQRRKAS